jgi:ubiquinone biosynthesis protein
VIATSLERPITQAFANLGPAVAAASIAQVHRGQVEYNGIRRAVAVKVLRPDVASRFRRDLTDFFFVAHQAEIYSAEARRLRLVEVINTMSRSVAMEMDLRLEAAAMSEMAENTRDDPDFRVPTVDWDRTAHNVLTMEWIDGIALSDHAKLEQSKVDLADLGRKVIQSFLRHALRDGFFHADMHPGNLFVDAQGRLVAVDFGIMGRLDHSMRRFMAETLGGFLARDYRRVAEVHFDAGFVPRTHDLDLFAQALRAIGEPIFGRGARDVSMAKLLQQLFNTTQRFNMQLQPQLVLLQKTMVVVEGVARGLDPDFDIWEASRPVVERWMLEHMGPQAQLRDAAEGMSALGRLARDLPQLLRNAETVSSMLADGGLRLHPDTAREISEAQLARTRYVRVAIWIAAGALVVLAAGAL